MIAKDAKIYVAGHNGLAGSAMVKVLRENGYNNLVFRTHDELDLTNQRDVDLFFEKERPDIVILFAAKVGGVYANKTYPADFLSINLSIQSNVIGASVKNNVKKLLFIASGVVYPRDAKHPLSEDSLLTGPFEPVNEPYAIAKVAGLKMCQYIKKQYGLDYSTVIPCNLYGPNDKFEGKNTHVIPATINKIHDSMVNDKPVVVWGTGKPIREFMYSDDLADACLFLLNQNDLPSHINVGSGEYLSINEMTKTIADVMGFEGEIVNDTSMPDGAPIITLDSTLINKMGWKAKISFREGIERTCSTFLRK